MIINDYSIPVTPKLNPARPTPRTGPLTTPPRPPRRTLSWRSWPTCAPVSPNLSTTSADLACLWRIWSTRGQLRSTLVYSGFAARRFDCDVRAAYSQGLITATPSFNSVNRYIADPRLTPIITDLIERSAAPLSVVESQFAADSSGFSTCRFDRWYDAKWGKEKSQRHWLKAHIVVGTQTNIITAVEVTQSNVNDSPVLPGLLDTTAQRFTMTEVSADKAYLSNSNLRHIEAHGADPYIPFKSNTTGQGSPMWKRLYAYFTLNEDMWKGHYHRRSNVETTFSMVKGKFRDSVRAKSKVGQVNEILLKCLCHNICVLIRATSELSITPLFGSN